MQTTPLRPTFYKTVDRMQVKTGVRAFDDFANLIPRCNAFTDGQSSSHVRPYNTPRMPMGEPCKPGAMREWDLTNMAGRDLPRAVRRWIEERTATQGCWLYKFSHLVKGQYGYEDATRVVHGWVVTRDYEGGIMGIIAAEKESEQELQSSLRVLTWCARVLMADNEHTLPDPLCVHGGELENLGL
jgi:hypothetical protein